MNGQSIKLFSQRFFRRPRADNHESAGRVGLQDVFQSMDFLLATQAAHIQQEGVFGVIIRQHFAHFNVSELGIKYLEDIKRCDVVRLEFQNQIGHIKIKHYLGINPFPPNINPPDAKLKHLILELWRCAEG